VSGSGQARHKVLVGTSREIEARLISVMLSILGVDCTIASSAAELALQCEDATWSAVMVELDLAEFDVAKLSDLKNGRMQAMALIGMTDKSDRPGGALKCGDRVVRVLCRPFGIGELSKTLELCGVPTGTG
jgi:hypothetical protein